MLPTSRRTPEGLALPAATQQQVHPHEAAAYSCLFSIRGSDIWQLSLRPLCQKWVVPLRFSDYLLVAIGIIACIAIKRYVCRFNNFYSRPLGILAAVACISIVHCVIRHRVTQYFGRVAQDLLQELRALVQQASPDNLRDADFDGLTERLQEDSQFEAQGAQLAPILERLLAFRRLLNQPIPDLVAIAQARARVFTP